MKLCFIYSLIQTVHIMLKMSIVWISEGVHTRIFWNEWIQCNQYDGKYKSKINITDMIRPLSA